MVLVKKIILDVLKPHQPNALDFSKAIAIANTGCRVHLTVLEMDENTETVQLEVNGNSIDFEAVQSSINTMGGSLHSIDEVIVHSDTDVD